MERAADEAGLRAQKTRDLDLASAAAENAAWKMASTKPTTAAGASALLAAAPTRPAGAIKAEEAPFNRLWMEPASNILFLSCSILEGLQLARRRFERAERRLDETDARQADRR
jgi:hypothetical protein